MKREKIILQARQYVGTPFVHQGRTGQGLDCVGLIVRVAHDLGLSEDDFRAYERDPDPSLFLKMLQKYLVRKKKYAPGDILIFALPEYPCHMSIYTNINTIIHALSRREKVVEHRLDSFWIKRLRSAWSFPGVEEWLN